VLPPLDADFFQQAQRLDEAAFKDLAREVIKFVRDEYGTTQLPTLETLFTQLQGYEQFLKQFYSKRGRRPGRYKRELDHLLELIPLLFRSALDGQTCQWHDRIAYALRRGDAVISFNYDVLIDEALARLATGRWKADRGYGFSIQEGTEAWSGESSRGKFPYKSYVRLLKPHGSLHWVIADRQRKQLRLDPDAYGQRSARGNIIPPTWDKQILGEWPWKPVWQEASNMLEQTRCLIVIGYSVPPTDLSSQALIRSSLSEGNLRLVVVANPDPEARARVIDLARGAITPSTRIFELEQLQDFAQLLDETPAQRQRRQELRRRVKTLDNKVDTIEDLVEDLHWHDLDDFDDRIGDLDNRTDQLENADVDGLEARVEALESLEGRVDELEAQLH
jgi:hypothetical protein